MADRPILFSAPMIRALLAGTKTQTRRVMKPQPSRVDGGVPFGDAPAWAHAEPGSMMMRCPYGKRGDRLWVRETWRGERTDDGRPPRDLDTGSRVWFEADGAAEDGGAVNVDAKPGKLRPSMFMPRWASRITLDVTGVRVERLQDISADDAKAEGAPPSHQSIDRVSRELGYADFPRSWYAQLWEQINGPGSWDANPWVWVVSFKRVTP